MIYYARPKNALGEAETVEHHLTRTAELCSSFLVPIGYDDWGYILGSMHDFAKYSTDFQKVLAKKKTGVNHSLPSAAFLYEVYRKKSEPSAKLMAAVVASHHCDLKCFEDYYPEIKESYNGMGKNLDRDNREYALFGKDEYVPALQEWRNNFSLKKDFPSAPSFDLSEDPHLSKMLFERFLYSALTDADWSSSAEHFDADYLAKHTGSVLNPEDAEKRLFDVLHKKQQSSSASADLNKIRDQLFDNCLVAGSMEPGLFTLTAPTGLGKTIDLLAFAIRQCIKWHKRRIIVVLPYLTIIEQNCKDYREIIPDLLELHSNAHSGDESSKRSEFRAEDDALSERWDVPCVVTTNVSFFEPLFSSQARQCRHLHQLSDSVIVLDEAQSLPSHLLDATLRTVKLLCDNYGCSAVFSTATQPSFKYRPGLEWNPREIAPNPSELFDGVRRVTWNWRVNEPISLSELAEEIAAYPQCCVIVNMKRHARSLLDELCKLRPEDEVACVSTDLCPAHRSRVLDEVRNRLSSGQPCCLVATQCIEAGVDLDFPVMYRALAPLDSIIQAAGRCNRNGFSPDGKVTVFLPEDEKRIYPSAEYERGALCVSTLLSRHEIDCNNLAHIEEYYHLLYADTSGDDKKLRDAVKEENYPETENQYKMIQQHGARVIVPYSEKMELYEKVRDKLDKEGVNKSIIRMAEEITVSCYDKQKVNENCECLYFRSYETGEKTSTNHYLLGIKDFYDNRRGLTFDKQFDEIY